MVLATLVISILIRQTGCWIRNPDDRAWTGEMILLVLGLLLLFARHGTPLKTMQKYFGSQDNTQDTTENNSYNTIPTIATPRLSPYILWTWPEGSFYIKQTNWYTGSHLGIKYSAKCTADTHRSIDTSELAQITEN
jgi:hypothetical protein